MSKTRQTSRNSLITFAVGSASMSTHTRRKTHTLSYPRTVSRIKYKSFVKMPQISAARGGSGELAHRRDKQVQKDKRQ